MTRKTKKGLATQLNKSQKAYATYRRSIPEGVKMQQQTVASFNSVFQAYRAAHALVLPVVQSNTLDLDVVEIVETTALNTAARFKELLEVELPKMIEVVKDVPKFDSKDDNFSLETWLLEIRELQLVVGEFLSTIVPPAINMYHSICMKHEHGSKQLKEQVANV